MWFEQRIEVIPAVDVLGTEAVRLHQGSYDDVVERADEPAALAARWVDAGARRVHLVDLDGARSGRARPELVETVAARIAPTPLQASGGIRSLDDAKALLAAGADRVVVGTAAWPDPTQWLELGEALVLALDVRDGRVRARGSTEDAGLTFDEALERAAGARVLVTAIDRDGTLGRPRPGTRRAGRRRPGCACSPPAACAHPTTSTRSRRPAPRRRSSAARSCPRPEGDSDVPGIPGTRPLAAGYSPATSRRRKTTYPTTSGMPA